MTIIKRFFFAFAVAAAFSLTSCNEYINRRAGGGDIAPIDTSAYDKYSFDDVFAKVIAPRCLGCHSTEKKDQPDLRSYATVVRLTKDGSPHGSDLYTSLQGAGGKMPKNQPGLGPNQLQLVKFWIQIGAPEHAGQGHEPKDDGPMPPDIQIAVEPTYASLNKNVFIPWCVKCHQPRPQENKGPAGDFDLTSYATTLTPGEDDDGNSHLVPGNGAVSMLYRELKARKMPKPLTDARLSDNVADAVLKWINDGAKNN